MAKSKSISDLVTDLQKENESLKFLKKLFERACVNEFGYNIRELHQILEKQHTHYTDISDISPDTTDWHQG